MRELPFLILAATLINAGCSHGDKKQDTEVKPTASTNVPKAAPEKAKSEPSKASAQGTKVECSVKGDDRVIEVRENGKGCELAYTKAGKEGIVASASNGKEYCEKAFEKLRDKLKGAGYACK